jgi:hypothetical protein
LEVPATVALNCWVVPVSTDVLVGVTATTTPAITVTFAVADMLGLAILVATTLTVAGVGAVFGAL